MRVRATDRGYYKGIREEGDEFDYDGELGSWMAPVQNQEPAAKAKAKAKPEREASLPDA